MSIPIVKIQYPSFIDFPKRVSLTLWVHRCNLSCKYCYNRHIVNSPGSDKEYEREIFSLLRKYDDDFLNGVNITGGEPMLHQLYLTNLINSYSNYQIPTKIDTNLTIPDNGLLRSIYGVSVGLKFLNGHFINNLKTVESLQYKELRLLVHESNKYNSMLKSIRAYLPMFDTVRISRAVYVDDGINKKFDEISLTDYDSEANNITKLLRDLNYKNDIIQEIFG